VKREEAKTNPEKVAGCSQLSIASGVRSALGQSVRGKEKQN